MDDNMQVKPEGSSTNILLYVVLAVLIVVAAVAIFFIVKIIVKNVKKRKADEKVHETIRTSTNQLGDKFGGRDNIEKIQTSLSRVTVLVKDPTLVDKAGIQSVIKDAMFMGNKIVFVIGSDSEEFQKLLEQNVDKVER